LSVLVLFVGVAGAIVNLTLRREAVGSVAA